MENDIRRLAEAVGMMARVLGRLADNHEERLELERLAEQHRATIDRLVATIKGESPDGKRHGAAGGSR